MSEDNQFNEDKPQIKTPRVTPLEGVSTYAPQGTRVRGVENMQGFDIDKRRCGLDIFGSLGKGALDKENIETLRKSSGLTPLGFGFDVDIREKVLNRGPMSEGLSTTELRENAEILMNSSGLSPLRPFGEIHNEDVKNDSLEERVSDKLDAETLENSSGLTTLHPDSEIHKKRVIE